MKAILQRVSFAEVKVDGNTVGKIDSGFLILLGIAEGDTQKEADALSAKISTLRVFTDENDKMNLSLADIDGEVLVISNFTLVLLMKQSFYGRIGLCISFGFLDCFLTRRQNQ